MEDSVRSADFKATREALSLTTTTLARELGVAEATIKNWERGRYAPPEGVEAELRTLVLLTEQAAQKAVSLAETRPLFLAYRLTEDMPPGRARELGAGWWRAVGYRARQIHPDLIIGYAEELYEITGTRESVDTHSITPGELSL